MEKKPVTFYQKLVNEIRSKFDSYSLHLTNLFNNNVFGNIHTISIGGLLRSDVPSLIQIVDTINRLHNSDAVKYNNNPLINDAYSDAILSPYQNYYSTDYNLLKQYCDKLTLQQLKKYNVKSKWWYTYYDYYKSNESDGVSKPNTYVTYYTRLIVRDANYILQGSVSDPTKVALYYANRTVLRAFNAYPYTRIYNPLSQVKIPFMLSSFGYIPFIDTDKPTNSLIPLLPSITKNNDYYTQYLEKTLTIFNDNRTANNLSPYKEQSAIDEMFSNMLSLKLKSINDRSKFRKLQADLNYYSQSHITAVFHDITSELYKYSPDDNYIEFKIYDVYNKNTIVLPAFISSIRDSSQPKYDKALYANKIYPQWNYVGNLGRQISFSLKLVCLSRFLLKSYLQKLNYIRGIAFPSYNKVDVGSGDDSRTLSFPVAPLMQLTIGDILKNTYGFFLTIDILWLDLLSIWLIQQYLNDFDNNKFVDGKLGLLVASRISSIYDSAQMPLVTNVNFSFNVVYNQLPELMGQHYFGLPLNWIPKFDTTITKQK